MSRKKDKKGHGPTRFTKNIRSKSYVSKCVKIKGNCNMSMAKVKRFWVKHIEIAEFSVHPNELKTYLKNHATSQSTADQS
jgi:hypothetical protein